MLELLLKDHCGVNMKMAQRSGSVCVTNSSQKPFPQLPINYFTLFLQVCIYHFYGNVVFVGKALSHWVILVDTSLLWLQWKMTQKWDADIIFLMYYYYNVHYITFQVAFQGMCLGSSSDVTTSPCTYLPLMDCDRKLLPIHFTSANQVCRQDNNLSLCLPRDWVESVDNLQSYCISHKSACLF